MAPRASWKGYLRLSLVSCPVRLYTATTSAHKVSFHMLHKDTHNRIQMRPHDPELGEVSRSDLVKGYEFDKDQYVVVDAEDLDTIQIESNKTISIDTFVDADDIDPIYLDSFYYIAPDGPVAEETYRVIHEAMTRANKAALAKIVLSNRERQVVLCPRGDGFAMMTLRTAQEVRHHEDYFADMGDDHLDPEMLQLAEMIVGQKLGSFNPKTFRDGYQEALSDLVKAKIKGAAPVIAKAPERGQVINLMDALRRSVEEDRKPAAKSRGRAAPKAGAKGAKKPAAKTPRKPAAKRPVRKKTAAAKKAATR